MMASPGDILAFIELGFKALEYLEGIHRAPKERNDLLKEIETLQSLLKQLNVIDALKQNLSAPERDEFQPLAQDFDSMLPKVQKKLSERNSRLREIFARIRWPQEKAGVQEALKTLKDLVGYINMRQEIAGREQMEVERKKAEIEKKKAWFRPAISESLRATRYIDADSRGGQQRTPGTGEGLLQSEQFKKWQSSRGGVLWCNGAQGSGKTMQIEAIADYLYYEEIPGHQYAIVYCHEAAFRSLGDPMDIVMSLWYQLDAKSGSSGLQNDETAKLYMSAPVRDQEIGMPRAKADDLKMAVICNIILNSPSTTLILDGLDEVPYKRTPEWQGEVIRRLVEIQTRTDHRCRLLITSRPYNSIRKLFDTKTGVCGHGTVSHYRLQVAELDLQKYIHDRIAVKGWALSNHPEEPRLIRYVHDVLVPKCRAEESFILAYFYVNEIRKATDEPTLREIVRNLPSDTPGVYRLALQRLSDTFPEPRPGLPSKAIRMLYWVLLARRPLTSDELEQCLLSEECEFTDINDSPMALKHGFEWLCGGLLVVDSSSAQVSVRHKTVADYLMDPNTIKEFWGQKQMPNDYFCGVLIKYLSFSSLKTSSSMFQESFAFETKLPLLRYALRHWGDYLEDTADNAEIWHKVSEFLKETAQNWHDRVNTVARAMFADEFKLWFRYRNDAVDVGIFSPLHWALLFNFPHLLKELSEHQRRSPSPHPVPISPLGVAGARNMPGMIKILLENGAHVDDAEAINRYQRPALYDAIMHNNFDCVRILFEAGADWTVRREDNDESVFAAIYWTESIEIAEMAADYVSNSNQASADGLQLLVQCGFTKQLQRAIDNGQNMNLPCHNGKQALDYAYELGNLTIIDILRSNGATTRLYSPPSGPGLSLYPELRALPGPESTGPSIVAQTPIVQGGKLYTSTKEVLVEVLVDEDFPLPVQSIIFETISTDQGWTSWNGHGTYMGSGVQSSFFVRIQNQRKVTEILLQNNVRASDKFRLHTNVWDLSALEASLPATAHCMKAMQPGSSVQLLVLSESGGWENRVRVARVRVQGKEAAQVWGSSYSTIAKSNSRVRS